MSQATRDLRVTDEFEHGVRCMDCERDLAVGDPYSERLVSMDGDALDELFIVELTCVPCGLHAATA